MPRLRLSPILLPLQMLLKALAGCQLCLFLDVWWHFLNSVSQFCGVFLLLSNFFCLTIAFSLQACWELGNAITPSQGQAECGWREALGQRKAPAEEGTQTPCSSPVLDWMLCSSQTRSVGCWTLSAYFFLRIGKGCCHPSSRCPDCSECPAGPFLIQPRPLLFQKSRLMIRQQQFIKEQSYPLLMGRNGWSPPGTLLVLSI